jgi:hypothetical protein
MSLSINDPATTEAHNTNNPYALTPAEINQMNTWNGMSDDEKGEYLFRAKESQSIADFIAQDDESRAANSNTVQHLASGETIVGGALHPDTLITEGGVEMTVQQAIDVGLFTGGILGQQVEDLR